MKTKSASIVMDMFQFLFASLLIGFVASLSMGAIVLMLSGDADATQAAAAAKPTTTISSSVSSQ